MLALEFTKVFLDSMSTNAVAFGLVTMCILRAINGRFQPVLGFKG